MDLKPNDPKVLDAVEKKKPKAEKAAPPPPKPVSKPAPAAPTHRQINAAGLAMIKEFEGLRTSPYLCSAGVATIGYGSTFYEGGTKVTMGDKAITEERATELLMNVLADFEKGVAAFIGPTAVSDNQFSAVVCFAYNVGLGALQKSTMLKLIRANDLVKAASEFPKWAIAGGKVLPGLLRRREAEQALFRKVG